MAETPKSKAKAPAKAAAKAEAKAEAKPKAEAKAPAKAAPAAPAAPKKVKEAKPKEKPKGWGRVAKGGADNHCSVEGCKRAYRAKGWCYFHYKKWRQGELPHPRYRTCSKAECRLKAVRHGLCEKHEAEVYGKEPAPAAAEPAA